MLRLFIGLIVIMGFLFPSFTGNLAFGSDYFKCSGTISNLTVSATGRVYVRLSSFSSGQYVRICDLELSGAPVTSNAMCDKHLKLISFAYSSNQRVKLQFKKSSHASQNQNCGSLVSWSTGTYPHFNSSKK